MSIIEKVEQTLYNGGGLTFKAVANLGQKTGSGNRLSALYIKEYDSSKYNGIGKLMTSTFSPSVYLSFSSYNEELKNTEEVYFSFPNFNDMEDFFDETMINLLKGDVYGSEDINPNYKELDFISPKLASGKQIKIIPYKIPINENTLVDGVVLMCNDEDHYGLVTLEGLDIIRNFIKSFNKDRPELLILLNQVYQNTMIYYNLLNNNSSFSSSSSNKPSFERKGGFGNKSSFGNNTKTTSTGIGEKREFKRRGIKTQTEQNTQQPKFEDIVETETKSNNISFDTIMQTANNIEDINIDDDVNFD